MLTLAGPHFSVVFTVEGSHWEKCLIQDFDSSVGIRGLATLSPRRQAQQTHLTVNSSLGLVPHLIRPQAWSAGFSSNSFSQRSAPTSLCPYPAFESGSTEIPSVRKQEEDIVQGLYHSCGLGSHTTSTPNKNEPDSLISGWEACMWETLGGKLQEGSQVGDFSFSKMQKY